jgi:predicted PurR-regulated permease PerM
VAIAKLKLLASRRAADPPLAAAPAATAAADEDDLTLPSDIKAVFLGGLFVLAMLAACYVAAEIVLPIVLAFVLSLVLQPAMRVLERIRLPRGIAAILLIFLLFGRDGAVGAGYQLRSKIAHWDSQLEERLSFLSRPIAAFQKFVEHAQGVTLGGEPKAVPVTVQGSALSDRLLSGTRRFASGLLETVLVLFFLLVSGDTFLRRLVEILPASKTSGRR